MACFISFLILQHLLGVCFAQTYAVTQANSSSNPAGRAVPYVTANNSTTNPGGGATPYLTANNSTTNPGGGATPYLTPNNSTTNTQNASVTVVTPVDRNSSSNPTAPASKEAPTPPSRNQRNLTAIIAGSSAGAFILLCAVIVTLMVMMRKSNTDSGDDDYMNQLPGMPTRFSYEVLRAATEDFTVKLGVGGFGTVFKGTLGDGTKVAVKRLDKMSHGMKEFLAEVESIGSIHHFNLVRLIGFCAKKSVRLLVYEYMSNGSLDNWIYHGGQKPCLGWQTRKKILLDIAKGLAYLHEDCRQRIVHLDIKPQNILLDENFNAKVSDFGLAKLIDRDESQVLTNMRGTPGYIAPEWRQLRITIKVDIYSFGIVLLEIVSGRKNFDRTRSESSSHLLRVLQEKAKEDRLIDIVENMDEDMQRNREEVVRMINIGAWCLQDDHRRRPSMSTLVKVFEGVMEVDPSITYRFTHAMASSSVANDHISVPRQASVSTPPQASVLSNPR